MNIKKNRKIEVKSEYSFMKKKKLSTCATNFEIGVELYKFLLHFCVFKYCFTERFDHTWQNAIETTSIINESELLISFFILLYQNHIRNTHTLESHTKRS